MALVQVFPRSFPCIQYFANFQVRRADLELSVMKLELLSNWKQKCFCFNLAFTLYKFSYIKNCNFFSFFFSLLFFRKCLKFILEEIIFKNTKFITSNSECISGKVEHIQHCAVITRTKTLTAYSFVVVLMCVCMYVCMYLCYCMCVWKYAYMSVNLFICLYICESSMSVVFFNWSPSYFWIYLKFILWLFYTCMPVFWYLPLTTSSSSCQSPSMSFS